MKTADPRTDYILDDVNAGDGVHVLTTSNKILHVNRVVGFLLDNNHRYRVNIDTHAPCTQIRYARHRCRICHGLTGDPTHCESCRDRFSSETLADADA